MLPLSLNYTQWPISGNPASQVMSVKLKYLCLAHRKHSVQEGRNEHIPSKVWLEPGLYPLSF